VDLTAVAIGVALGASACGLLMRRRVAAAPPAAISTQPIEDDHARELADQLRTAIVQVDPSGRAVLRNSAADRLRNSHSGYLIEEAIERHLAVALEGSPSEETLEFFGPPKQVVVVHTSPLPGGGAVAIADDISERRRLDAMRTDFVANISHELKTPVGAMAVLADALVGEDDQETIQRLVGRMVFEAERAARTIDDLLQLTEIELGAEIEAVPLDAVSLMQAAVERIRHSARERSVEVCLSESVSPITVIGEPRQLASALGNLVENAVKYSEVGGRVDLAVDGDDDGVAFTVTDDGVGIPQRDVERIFERFYRVDKARSRGTGGTGLGLAIVRHVATNHGGEVEVTSAEGEGSTFVLRIPHGTPAADVDGVESSLEEVEST
jgi:two-component system, OmpR family, sensor histidine kinase SenX3